MKTGKTIFMNILAIMCALYTVFATVAFASSLEDILDDKVSTQVETVEENNSENVAKNNEATNSSENSSENSNNSSNETITGNKIDEDLSKFIDATTLDVDLDNEQVNKMVSPLKRIVSVICTVLLYAIAIFIPLTVLLDVAYIKIPFIQNILANGNSGNEATMNGNNGYNNGSYGYGSGYGHSGYGYNNGGYGYGNNGYNSMNNGMNNANGRVRFVSRAAMRAVEAEGQVDQSGNARTALSIYMKDMIVQMVLTPVLLVLIMSGKLTEVGFKLGAVITEAIGNF